MDFFFSWFYMPTRIDAGWSQTIGTRKKKEFLPQEHEYTSYTIKDSINILND